MRARGSACVVAGLAFLAAAFYAPEAFAWPRGARWPAPQHWDPFEVEAGGVTYRAYSFDGHVHTEYSHDAIHTVDDVVRLAERADLDALVFTDHGSSEAAADAVATHTRVVALTGQEVGGDYGHALMWNVPRHSEQVRRVREMRTLGTHVHGSGGMVVLAHPNWWIGQHAHDPRRWMAYDSLRRGGISESVDALELWNGVYPRYARQMIEGWDQLLSAGLYVPIVANSDYHRHGSHRVGTPRNVFFCPADRRDIGPCLIEAARAGRLYVSDGPVVAFTVADQLPGGIVTTRAGASLEIAIRARAPEGGTLELVIGGAVEARWELAPGVERAVRHTWTAPSSDTFVRVEVTREVEDILRETPFSMLTNPVRIDVGAPRSDGWRGPPASAALPAPSGFELISVPGDRWRHYRFLTPLIGAAPTRDEVRREARARVARRPAVRARSSRARALRSSAPSGPSARRASRRPPASR